MSWGAVPGATTWFVDLTTLIVAVTAMTRVLLVMVGQTSKCGASTRMALG